MRTVLLAVALIAGPAVARPAPLPDSFQLGRDANAEPCVATRRWRDPRMADPFDRAWGLGCRGVAVSRQLGVVLALRLPPPADDAARCGATRVQPLAGIGPVETRACADPALGLVTRVRFMRDGRHYLGEAPATALGPLEVALKAVAGIAQPPFSRDTAVAPSLDAAGLDAPPAAATSTVAGDLDVEAALQAGIQLNQRGLYIEASRLLNDALSRFDARTPPATRAELRLEAGLADSNIRQFDAADEHFLRADERLKQNTDLDRAAYLESKRATYRGLDLINRRQWRKAVVALSDARVAPQPLRDPAILGQLNAPPRRGAAASLSSADAAQMSRLLVEAQRDWARSVAQLAVGDAAASRAALDQAAPYIAELERNAGAAPLAALKSRVLRQYGRIEARAGRYDAAVVQFDCALATLQGAAAATPGTCRLPVVASVADTNAQSGPLMAETQLERASLLARRSGADAATVLRDFDTAVDALIGSGAAGGVVQPAMEAYLDLLVARHAAAPSADLAQRYFRAVQAVGEPAIARQVAQLQSIVTASGPLAAKVRDRDEIERRIIRLRYAIGAADPARAAELEVERRAAEAALLATNIALAGDPRFRVIDDQPVTLDALRAALRPGEYYLKVTRLRSRAYAMAIGRDASFIHVLAAPAADVDRIAKRVRASIRDDSGELPFFDVAASYALFRLVAGPAEAALAGASAIVIDPSGPLENLPAGVLVTTRASVQAYAAARGARPNDYSRVAFLGARAEVANALSARAFLIARGLPGSTAAKPFIGFGENALPQPFDAAAAATRVAVGSSCDMTYGELAALMAANKPVSAAEIGVAAAALGAGGAPEIRGRAFTDTALVAAGASGEYAGYQVLHFATHGLPESQAGDCARIPPSLVTTLAPPGPADGAQSDGLLSLGEVAQLRLDANLVVLSACETASGVSGLGGRMAGQDESSATLDGLVRAFVTANARAVVATYWQVPAKRGTEELIATFYRAGRTETIGAALKTAQARLIAQPDVSHPYFWGAFFLVGDGGKTMLTQAPAVAAAAVPAVLR